MSGAEDLLDISQMGETPICPQGWFDLRLSMNRRLGYRLPPADQLLNHAIAWLAIILVVGAVAFGVYYYYDRQVGDTGQDPVAHQIELFEQAVIDDPSNMAARLGLGDLYFRVGRYRESADQYEAVVGVTQDDDILPLWGLGRGLYFAGDSVGSEQTFQRIIDLGNENDIRGDLLGAAYYYTGRIALDRGDPAKAVASLKTAVSIDRADADSMEMLGLAYVANGQYDEGIAQLTKAVQFVPDFGDAYAGLATAYEAKGMAGEARWARAMVLFSEDALSKAVKELEAVTAAMPEFAPGFTGLGLAKEKQGKREEAAKAFGRAVALAPDDFNARAGLSRLGLLQPSGDGFHGSAQQTPAASGGGQ